MEKKYEMSEDEIHANDKRLKLLDELSDFVIKTPKFDPTFFYSILESLKKKGKISAAQYNALVKVYYAFHLHKLQKEKL